MNAGQGAFVPHSNGRQHLTTRPGATKALAPLQVARLRPAAVAAPTVRPTAVARERDSCAVTALAEITDRALRAALVRFTAELYRREPARISRRQDVGAGLPRRPAGGGRLQMPRGNDLMRSRLVREYLMGERAPMNDPTAWNGDATHMPYRMHSEY